MVDMRSQLLHRTLVEELNKRLFFNTVGAVHDIGFPDPTASSISSSSHHRRRSNTKIDHKHHYISSPAAASWASWVVAGGGARVPLLPLPPARRASPGRPRAAPSPAAASPVAASPVSGCRSPGPSVYFFQLIFIPAADPILRAERTMATDLEAIMASDWSLKPPHRRLLVAAGATARKK
uniref:Uncharacterized protein n=1 Tax=Oryza sativa subsp. japonica TaxID=39947 RepID=Q852A5_ORYSJ|nr:hypothetical protein [Oryza sativa Japonica Group]